jgi:hypothetical protein
MKTSKRLTYFDPGIVLEHNAVWTSRTSAMATIVALNYMLLVAIKEGEESVWDNIETGPAGPNGQPIGLNGQQTDRNGQHTCLKGQHTDRSEQTTDQSDRTTDRSKQTTDRSKQTINRSDRTTDWSEQTTNRSITRNGQPTDLNGQPIGQSSSGTTAIKVERNYNRTRKKANDVRHQTSHACIEVSKSQTI